MRGRKGTLSPSLFPLSMCKKKPKQEAKGRKRRKRGGDGEGEIRSSKIGLS